MEFAATVPNTFSTASGSSPKNAAWTGCRYHGTSVDSRYPPAAANATPPVKYRQKPPG
jgi:hypothetical protein